MSNLSDISYDEKLYLLLDFFDQFEKKLKEIANPYKGSEKFASFSFEELFGEVKEKNVLIDEESKQLEEKLLKNKWYVLDGFNGTSEGRESNEFINSIEDWESKTNKGKFQFSYANYIGERKQKSNRKYRKIFDRANLDRWTYEFETYYENSAIH